MHSTIKNILEKFIPKEYAEFHAEPWDFKIFAPCNLDEDEAVISIWLYIGKERAMKRYDAKIHLLHNEPYIAVTVERYTGKDKYLRSW